MRSAGVMLAALCGFGVALLAGLLGSPVAGAGGALVCLLVGWVAAGRIDRA